ncbi:hypothetical protein [Metabacillus fastidiosus]|uniref:hypothetical protein n=1 Tax=Metabacillus fastidiosus TaxID=1458 RepID=UPI003D291897
MTVIKVVDSIMGTGKTSSAINLMNEDTEHNYIFITPYLNEVERIKKSCENRKFFEPKPRSEGGKFESLHNLLAENRNIVSTHALFKRANDETKELINAGNYILILDEVMDVVEQLEIKKDDLQALKELNLISIDENNYVIWNEDKLDYDSRYNDIKDMAVNKTLLYYKETILMWNFPVEVFKMFKEVYILTYLFDAQIQKYYYDYHGLAYDKYIAAYENDKYIFKKNDNYSDKEVKQQIKTKVNIYEGNLNDIGNLDYSLSKSWYTKKSAPTLKKLKNNIENYYRNILKSKSDQNMWTTHKDYQGKLKGKGYTKGFVQSTARATNEFKDRTCLAYTINRFVNPILYGFFHEKGVTVNQDEYALSEMIQWIWRSAIRDDKEINLYIPSKRMRVLLMQWLNDEQIHYK